MVHGFQLLMAGCLMLSCSVPTSGQEWNEFRGPQGTGKGIVADVPLEWSAENTRWHVPIPGRGWSSPVVQGEQVWFTTAIEHSEPKSESEASPNGQGILLQAICVDRTTGKLTHQIDLFQIDNPPALHTRNSYASPTPVIDGDRVVCSFGTMGTAAIQVATGDVLWRSAEYQFDHETGPGSSPIIWKDLVFIHCDGTDQQFVVALNKETGKEVWKTARSGELHENGMMKKAFSTPLVIEVNGRSELISAGANWVYSYDPESGRELWKKSYGQLGFSNVPKPLFEEGVLYVCTGFMRPALLAIRLSEGDSQEAEVSWTAGRNAPTIPTPLIAGDLVFMISDNGIASCLDKASGEEIWKERLSGEYTASPVLIGDKILFCSDTGVATWVKPDREFKILATNTLDGPIMATPAVTPDAALIRTRFSLYSIGAKK
jgi:outer membrane protein assembly factor BamB